tara:strand:+ start:14722 stop:14967 length:246 start_codon:yes stop_codon:yes gene_type:complete
MKKELTIFDNPENAKRVRLILYVLCALLFLGDIFVHKHGHFGWDEWFGFFAIYGFVCCVGLVLAAKHWLRTLTKRDEDYYD